MQPSAQPLEEVQFGEKSDFQKGDCINEQCQDQSTMEAFLGTASIRTCTREICRNLAAQIACDSNGIALELECMANLF